MPTETTRTKDLQTVESFCLSLLQSWLATRSKGETGMSWVYNTESESFVPKGYIAVVKIELHKLGGEPKEYEKCIKCGNSKVVGEACKFHE